MDRHHQQEARDPVLTSSPFTDVDPRSPNASRSPDRNFFGHSARGSAGGVRDPPLEQPLDFSLKSAAASSCSSPLSSEDDRRPSPECVALGAACSQPEASNRLPCPESHQCNPSLLIPRTATNTSASTSPPAPFQNGYVNGYAGASGPLQGLQSSPLMTFLRSPPRSNLSVSPAPPLVRPPPQQPAFPSLRSPPSVNAPTSPQPSAPSQTGKYVRPFKAYKPVDLLPMDLYSVSNQLFPAASAAAAGFRLADRAAQPEFVAYCKRFLQAVHANGRQERQHRRSRPAGSASAAAGSAHQLSSTSPPPQSNGAPTTCRADSGEEGSTSPENSDSSALAVTNGDASTSGPVTNGGTTTNGGAPTANGGGVVAANGDPPNGAPSAATGGGPVRNGRRRSRLPDSQKDEAYWQRRRKNNEAAKRSRDARRAKEDEIAIRCTLLQNENTQLHCEITSLRNEMVRLHNELSVLRKATMYANAFCQ
ncbi:uncharacterized protein [Dermacentor andersoni]|uniref:uncharacterized protein n=1 Tax=Dermacentor andersoni TaxID=34620 RepID=UPI0021552876|nr:proline-rich protein 36-like [Dermacentor andersoni]